MSQPKSSRISVVMRTKNCEHTVAQALLSLRQQTDVPFELIVVDSGSQDATRTIASRYADKLVRIEADEYVPGPVLNNAIRNHCQGDIVVFQNSDVVLLSPTALVNLTAPLRAGDAEATFARQIPRPEAYASVRNDYARAFPAHGDTPDWLPYSLPFAAMSRAAWEQQPFYEAAWGSEDTMWGTQARARGFRVKYCPHVEVMHSHNYTLKQTRGRRFIEGEADAFIYPRSLGAMALLLSGIKATVRDIRLTAREKRWGEIPRIPTHHAYGQIAYWQGHRLGTQRQAQMDENVKQGQSVVLRSQ